MNAMKRLGLALGALALIVAGPVRGGTIFTTEASFLAALSTSYTENYSALPTTGFAPVTFSGNGFSYDCSCAARIASIGAIVPQPGGGFAVDPNELMGLLNALFFTNFNGGGVDAIGGYFYNVTLSGTFDGLTINLLFSDGFQANVFSSGAGFPSYFGYVASPGTKLTSLYFSSPAAFPGVDRLTVGNAVLQVPEPSTLWMVGIAAFVGLTVYYHRRRWNYPILDAVASADHNRGPIAPCE